MDPKNKEVQEYGYDKYRRYSWFENEYSIYKFTEKEWNKIYREFGGLSDKQIHIPETVDSLFIE